MTNAKQFVVLTSTAHSRGTACRARSRQPLNLSIELNFANALLAFVILSAAKDLSCQ